MKKIFLSVLFVFVFVLSLKSAPSLSNRDITIDNTQKIQVFLKTLTSKTPKDPPKWKKVMGQSNMDVAPDGYSAYLVSSDVPGDSIFYVTSDFINQVINLHIKQSLHTFLFNSDDALIFPMMKLYTSSYTSNGNYVTSFSSTTSGSVLYPFDIDSPSVDNYSVFARVLAQDGMSDSFFVAMDSGTLEIFDAARFHWSPDWQWVQVSKRISDTPRIAQPVKYYLSQGPHHLIFQTRDAGTGIDQVLITNDVSITTKTLSSYPTYYQTKIVMDGALVSTIIHNEIKPIYDQHVDTNADMLQQCLAIWGIVEREIDPIDKPYEDAFLASLKAQCPTCTYEIQKSTDVCKWM